MAEDWPAATKPDWVLNFRLLIPTTRTPAGSDAISSVGDLFSNLPEAVDIHPKVCLVGQDGNYFYNRRIRVGINSGEDIFNAHRAYAGRAFFDLGNEAEVAGKSSHKITGRRCIGEAGLNLAERCRFFCFGDFAANIFKNCVENRFQSCGFG